MNTVTRTITQLCDEKRIQGQTMRNIKSAAMLSYPIKIDMNHKKEVNFLNVEWALSSDSGVYVRLKNMLNVTEECYENQRWHAGSGFSDKLFPTDPHAFSSQDGKADRKLDSVQLPSELWAWEDKWHLELNINGTLLDNDGWMYASNFTGEYTPSATPNSFVRRRKWKRNRSFVNVNCWVPLPNSTEPITDIAVRIHNQLASSAEDPVSVWAVTKSKGLLFRDGISLNTCPEGNQWLKIETPASISQVYVTPKGILVVVAQNGELFARDPEVTGSDWLAIPPENEASDIDDFIKDKRPELVKSNRTGSDWLAIPPENEASDIDDKRPELVKSNRTGKIAGAVAGGIGVGILAGVAAPVAIPALLGTVGFTSAGVAAGSVAAGIQAGIGSVAAGSLFALCQSVGAAGIAASTAATIGAWTAAAAGAVAGVVAAKTTAKDDSKEKESQES